MSNVLDQVRDSLLSFIDVEEYNQPIWIDYAYTQCINAILDAYRNEEIGDDELVESLFIYQEVHGDMINELISDDQGEE